jgi:RNA polymerase sigma-70 factor (ECF subfamily)
MIDQQRLHALGGAAGPMVDRITARAKWIEQNLLPHESRVRAWLNRNRVPGLDVDDVIQEMYARIGSLDNVEDIREPGVYAMKVAHSILFNYVHRSRIVSITAIGDLNYVEIPSPEASPEDELMARDEVQLVTNALAELPRRTRDVLLLRRVEGLSQRETAARLAIAEKTVEKHMARAALYLTLHFGRGGKNKVSPSERREILTDDADDATD